jgi:hypothetical protein
MLLAGMPPSGLGCYVRDVVPGAPFRFRVINAARNDHAQQVARARELGGEVWLYSTPNEWRPTRAAFERSTDRTWQEGLARIVERALAAGADGIIADPEGGWTGAHDGEAEQLGRALAEVSSQLRVGVTSYPSWAGLEPCARAAGDRVFGSVQIYGRDANSAEAFAGWFNRWHRAFGSRLGLSIAGWYATEAHRGSGFRAYLERLPRASSAIAWLGTGEVPEHIAHELSLYSPGGSTLGTILESVLAFTMRPAGVVVLVVLAVVVVLVAALVTA